MRTCVVLSLRNRRSTMRELCIFTTSIALTAMRILQFLSASSCMVNDTLLQSEPQAAHTELTTLQETHFNPTGPWTPKMTRASEPTKVGDTSRESSWTPRSEGRQELITDIPEYARNLELLRTSESPVAPTSSEGITNSTKLNGVVHLYLGTEETVDCFNHTVVTIPGWWDSLFRPDPKATQVYLEVNALKGSIVLKSTFDKQYLKNLKLQGCEEFPLFGWEYRCYCAVRVRIPSGFHFLLVDVLEHTGSEVHIYDDYITRIFKPNKMREEMERHTLRDVANIVQIVETSAPVLYNQIKIRFKALRKQGLKVKFTGTHRGIGKTSTYMKPTMITKQKPVYRNITVPLDHVIMLSFPGFERINQYIKLFAKDNDDGRLVQVFRDSHDPSHATIYNTSLLVIQLYRYLKPFRFYFSFHNGSSLPTKLPDDSWNCSVPYVSDFLYHLSCNIMVECGDAADEMDCSYTTDLCGPRYVTLGGACFFYIMHRINLTTWNEASGACFDRGGRLASLNTVDKWNDAQRLMPVSGSDCTTVHVGIKRAPSFQPPWYQYTYQWSDTSSAFFMNKAINPFDCKTMPKQACGLLTLHDRFDIRGKISIEVDPAVDCNEGFAAHVLCEKEIPFETSQNSIEINGTKRWPLEDDVYVRCPQGHYTHRFLACDIESSCWYSDRTGHCESTQASFLRTFVCTDGFVRLPYELLCDHRADCVDGSDEDFCIFPPCLVGHFMCSNKECIPNGKVNDGWKDCYTGDDEYGCPQQAVYLEGVFPPALVNLTERGALIVRPLDTNSSSQQQRICPDTHFQCNDNGFCLPVILRCNGINDCPGREDETNCDACPDFYRCRKSRVCVFYSELCDGHSHCPQRDDELMCNSTCPPFCVCRGLTFFCSRSLSASDYPLLRYLDASSSGLNPARLTKNAFMIYLSLAKCDLSRIDGLSLPNLLSLDARDNNLRAIGDVNFIRVPQLRELLVAGNPLTLVFEGAVKHILKLDLSRVMVEDLNLTALTAFPSLHVLNLSDSGVRRVQGAGFGILEKLRVVDLRGCPMTWFPRGLFHGLKNLEVVHAHNFKVCCSAVLPLNFNLHKCYTLSNEISSCEDLLRGKIYSVCVFVLSLLAVVGNSVSFVFRSFVSKRENKLGYGNFVTHLSVSDFLMGVYLAIIGAADQVFRGTYLWNDVAWRFSVACKLAGFVSLLSSEVSTLIMCLITMDRFLVLRFPFSQLHFGPTSAHIASVVVWVCGVVLVSVPLLPWTSTWNFYSQTSICIPLPTTRTSFTGHGYSFSILIVFNFVLFLIISMGQLSIYVSIRANAMSVSNTTKKTKDLSIARRLITVAISDFLCWFPVGVMGFLAFNDIPIPGEVNVIVAIFVLPLNSAVNPCLYTLNVILERRSRAREDKLRALLLAQLKARN